MGFWRKCRVCFRWCRISVWLLVLAVLCGFLWLNRIGLPDFLKTRLVATLHERGVELEFTRMRLRLDRGIVAENVRIGDIRTTGRPTLTLAEMRLQLDFSALLHRQLQVAGLGLHRGRLVWSVSPTNELRLDNLQANLRFQADDTWRLDKFRADFAGTSLILSGEIRHAPELQNWEVFQGPTGTNRSIGLKNLQQFTETLDRIHLEGGPQLSVIVTGDARDIHSFVVRSVFNVPSVEAPWFGARDIQIIANLTVPADVPATCDPAWGFWTNVQPYRLEWSARLAQLTSKNLNADFVTGGGFWNAPDLVVTNLSVGLGGGRLEAGFRLNVATRELAVTNSSCFELSAIAALLPEKVRERLKDFHWEEPPVLQAGGVLILPSWTNAAPDWNQEVLPTLRMNGSLALTNGTVLGAMVDSAYAQFSCSNRVWRLPDLALTLAKTQLAVNGQEDDATKDFHLQVRGVLDPEVARPFLKDTNALHGFEMVKFSRPLALEVAADGRWDDYDSIVVDGHLAVTNFTVRGERFGAVTSEVKYGDRVLMFLHPEMHDGEQMATADSLTLDFRRWMIFFTNVFSIANADPVARAIGPQTGELVAPYHFERPPTTRVNGHIPLTDLHGGPEMAEVDMRFEIHGGPFQWLKLRTDDITGNLNWRGQVLELTNVVGEFYGGRGRGFANFDFRVAHEGADYEFMVAVTNASLHRLAVDLSSPTNKLEGTFGGLLAVTNASTMDLDSWNGYGHASLRDGLLWDIPIVSIVSPMLNAVSPGLGNSRATDAAARFVITNGVFLTDSLVIRSTMTRLEYVGTIDLAENVNAKVTAQLLRDTWVVGPLVSTVLWPVSKLFEYHVTGTLETPKSEPIYVLPKLLQVPLHPIRSFEELMPPGTSTNRPAGSSNQ